jgi:predicted N-acetyltransferase YhbS
MEFRHHTRAEADLLAGLFTAVFTSSEGPSEGALVGDLVRDLVTSTDDADLVGHLAVADGQVVGAIFFSRLRFAGPMEAFLMAPVAVRDDHQGRGVGQALITHGLQDMRSRGADLALTYGDPAYYGKLGFQPVTVDQVPAPLALSQPEGWLGQSLNGEPLGTVAGPCTCVAAFDDPALW